jgi:regulator of protease activity HflC (stomatin/prohibitin superfamily)
MTTTRTTLSILLIAFACVFLAGCSTASAGPGEQVVLVKKPLIFGHGGVDPTPVTTGLEYIALTTDEVKVSMQPIRVDEEFKDLMSKDNVPLDFHVAARLQITDSVRLIDKFGEHWYQNNVQRAFQNLIRDHGKQYSMPDLAVNQSVLQDVEKGIFNDLNRFLASINIPVIAREVTVGKVNPPEQVLTKFAETAAEQQRIKTEEQRKRAEDSRKAAEESRAAADKAYQEKMGISAAQFVTLETMKMCAQKQNCSVFMGAAPVPVVGK